MRIGKPSDDEFFLFIAGSLKSKDGLIAGTSYEQIVRDRNCECRILAYCPNLELKLF